MPSSGHLTAGGAQPYSLLIGVGIALVVVLLRNSRPRKLKIERMWLFPLVYVVMLAAFFYAEPPPITGVSMAILGLSLVVGCALGWQRGRFMRIDIDPDTHEMTSRASVVGIAFIMVVMVARMALRTLLQEHASFLHVPTIAFADGLVLLAVGMLSTQRLEVWLRARQLLENARAAKAGAIAEQPQSSPPIVQ